VTEAGRGLTGRQLGPYRLDAVIGVGSFGYVYRAQHLELNVARVVKILPGEIASEPQLRLRFQQEGRTAASLSHPNIVQVHDFGVEDAIPYLAMDFVESLPLSEHLQRLPVQRRLDSPLVRQCVRDIAAALDYAHSRGVTHRDLKPANVLVRNRDTRALLTDFGLAYALSDPELTTTSRLPGTYAYLSPEQCRGERELTPQTDVYAFAAILYEIATGMPPFGRGIMAVAGHVNRPVPPLRLAGSHLPAPLDAVLSRGMAKAPGERYRTGGELANAFLAVVAPEQVAPDSEAAAQTAGIADELRAGWEPPDLSVQEPPPPSPEPPRELPRPSRRAVLVAGGAGAAVAALAATAVGVGWLATHLPRPGPTPTAPPALPTPPPQGGLPRPVQGTVGRPATLAGLQLTVSAVDTNAPASASVQVPPGSRLVSVEVLYRNVGRQAAAVSPFDWALVDGAGTIYTPVQPGTPGDLAEAELAPGRTARGVFGFVVPQQAQSLLLQFDAEVGDAAAVFPVS
jgi:serine/threonine protein kinase, bacterial